MTCHEHRYEIAVADPARAETWRQVLGQDRLPILSPVPELMDLPELGPRWCYLLDLDALTDEQRGRLARHLIERFDVTRDDIRRELPHGVPIPADDAILTVCCVGAVL